MQDYYAEAAWENELGIRFCDPKKRQVGELEKKLQEIADHLGVEMLPPVLPPKGFLIGRLTQDQRQKLNLLLGPKYAERNADQQLSLHQVIIQECNERMVSLQDTCVARDVKANFSTTTFHEACGVWAKKPRIMFTRMEVANGIAHVTKAFNAIGLKPYIEDCWRPPEVQRGLLIRRIVDIARKNIDWDTEKVKMVATSLTAPSPGLAGHQAGAAVDLRLQRTRNGKFLDIGNEYAETGAVSSIDFPYVTFSQWIARTLFANTMRMGGFKLLTTENWHASRKDRGMGVDGSITMQKALYGPLKHFDRKTGVVTPYPSEEVDVPALSDGTILTIVHAARTRKGNDWYTKHINELIA
jgi:D-alanyl-D-alanine dipeptidase